MVEERQEVEWRVVQLEERYEEGQGEQREVIVSILRVSIVCTVLCMYSCKNTYILSVVTYMYTRTHYATMITCLHK